MGWTSMREPLGCTRDEFLRREMTWSREGRSSEVVDTAWVGATCYMAVRHHSDDEKAAGYPDAYCSWEDPRDFVGGVVVLTEGSGKGGFAWNILGEEMGPYESNAPASLLGLLTPLKDTLAAASAKAWRERCSQGARQ